MERWQCLICQYVYDPAIGDPDGEVMPGTRFEDIPEGWICPICGAGKDAFVPLQLPAPATKIKQIISFQQVL